MGKNEASSQFTGEEPNPLVRRQRRAAGAPVGYEVDPQAAQADGIFPMVGFRKAGKGSEYAPNRPNGRRKGSR